MQGNNLYLPEYLFHLEHISVIDEPVPLNTLEAKSNEYPVIVSTSSTVALAPAMSATLGLKSTQSLKKYLPAGSLTSGSTLDAPNDGISL